MSTAKHKYAALREAALRVVEGWSDGIGADFMSDILKALQERDELIAACDAMSARYSCSLDAARLSPTP